METSNENDLIQASYEVWKQFNAKFSIVLSNDFTNISPSEKERYINILQDIFKTYHTQCKHLVPQNNDKRTLERYTCFNIWLFGQFVNVYLHDHFDTLKNKSMQAQIALLQYICERNPFIYDSLMCSYVEMLGNLCNLMSSQDVNYDNSVFKWFQYTGNSQIALNQPTFRIKNRLQLDEAVALTLKIFKSPVSLTYGMRAASLTSLWHSAVVLLRYYEYDKSMCYYLITRLINENELPDHEHRFSSILSEVLLHIMNDIGKLCQVGKIRGEEEFCVLLSTLSEHLCSELCYDLSYINSTYCLIFQCQVPLAELTEDTVLKFFAKLLSLSSSESVILGLFCDSHVHPFNLSLFAIALENAVHKQIQQVSKTKATVDVYQSNKHWKLLIEQTGKYILDVEKRLNTSSIKQMVAVFKLVQNITRAAVNISYQFTIDLNFFGDEIHSIISRLMKIMEVFSSKKILRLFLNIIRDVLMLPETRNRDEKRNFSLALLTFPLSSFEPATLPVTFYDKCSILIDDELRILCITSTMQVRDLTLDEKSKLYRDVFANPCALVFQHLPTLIHRLTDDELRALEDYFFEADAQVLTEFSPFIRKSICAIDGHCVLCKLPNRDIEVYCQTCDSECVNVTEKPTSAYRRRIIKQLIFSVISATDVAKLNVLSAAIQLSNHICDNNYEIFLTLLHNCFSSEDAQIRRKIVEITPRIIFKYVPTEIKSLDYSTVIPNDDKFRCYIKSLQEVIVTAVINEDSQMQYVCIKTIAEIGSIPIEMTLLPCIHLLINPLILACSKSSSLAKSTIEKIARAHDQVEEHIYLKYRDAIMPLITHLIVMNFSIYKTDLYGLHFDYATVFNPLTQPHILKHLLPHAVHYPEAERIVAELAEMSDISVGQMLKNGFRHIFLHVMMFEEPEKAIVVLQLIERETGEKISNMLGGCVAKVLADLLIYYEKKTQKVQWCILAIRKLLSKSSLADMLTLSQPGLSVIVPFVQHRFFGIMMSLENQLCSDITLKKSRRQIITSLRLIIELMGSSYITSVRFKVLLTLRTIVASEKATSPEQCIHLWNTFVRTIDPKVLGPILSTIFVSLLPFENFASQINDIFSYLVVENESAIRDHLHELYFVEPHQCDEQTYRVIRSSETFAQMNLQKKLDWLTELSQHEIVEIKLHALKRLKNELSASHSEISQLILGSDSINSVIPRVLNALVDGFRNRDEHIQEASGVCLGEFGAVDPSYIPNTVIKVDDAKKYTCYAIDDLEFVINTLTVLCRGFQMAKNSVVMDTFALAIQTTLKTYNVTDAENCVIWSKIPKNLREIIQPFHTTTYVLLSPDNESANNIPHLIYNTRHCTSVQKWAHSWSHFLISLLPTDTKERNIFHCFKGVISYDNESMLFFLPHILLNAVLSASEGDLVKIYEEMMSVILDDRRGAHTDSSERSSTQLVVTEELSIIRNVNQTMDVICVKTVFRLLDVLHKKHRDMRATTGGKQSSDFKKLSNFLSKFSTLQLAKKSFERKEYSRSLLYTEEYLSKNEKVADAMDKHLSFLVKTYVYLNDVDNVKGLFAKHSIKLYQPQHVIMLHEITDQFQDAAICYQQLLKDSDEERSLLYEKRMISGYLAMNQPEMALRLVSDFSAANMKNSKLFDDVKCEALWNLGQYDDLAKLTATKSAQTDESWGVRIGQAIVHFLNHRPVELTDELARIRKTLTKSLHLSSAAFGGYKECYESVVKLHVLNEFEKVADLVFTMLGNNSDQHRFQSVIKNEFEKRLNKLQPVSRVLQPVLNIRQTLFSVARHLSTERPDLVATFNEEIRKCWLKVIEIANRTRNFQLAYSNILPIDNYQLKGFFIEKAKYYWQKMEQSEALRTLQHGVQYHYRNFDDLAKNKTVENREDRKICAEAMLLIGTYNDAMVNTDLLTNLQYFQNAVQLYSESEKVLVKFAQYADKICASAPTNEIYRKRSDLHLQSVRMYGNSLKYGCEFIYQSLSRMLNIWMDFATVIVDDRGRQDVGLHERRKALREMNKYIETFIMQLPAYYFCTAFSLVMSRLTHPLQECFDKLCMIIIKCILNYPNQTLWQFMSLYKTKDRSLSERFNKIINNSQLDGLASMKRKFQELFEQCSSLCLASKKSNHPSGPALLTNLTKNTPLLNSGQFDDVLIPAQKFLTIILPRSVKDVAEANNTYNPYPEKMVYISRLRNEIHVYSSLQKPIRVNLVGTDGRDYPMIFKAYDDMRIDRRCMEFNSVVNMYLKRDVEARDRVLKVRTYTVLPLLEKCGVMEFIPNLLSMRGVNLKMRKNFGMSNIQTKQYECRLEDSLDKKMDTFKKLVSMFPPLLHEWYKQEFHNPTSWCAARTAYVRTLGVMSIVGYTLGLGDRHNDNILLDSTNGDVIHVDLNVMFNKGELLQVPERVPFRLTHSMIKAMGPLGYEGTFLCTSEIVNRILRERKEQLISVLNTFLYDPPEPTADRDRQDPRKNLRNVELRLDGCITAFGKQPSIPLSVEGQTRKLIEEATDEDNLCQMYIGWGAFM